MKVERDMRPLWLGDYSYFETNANNLLVAFLSSMQYGRALDRLLFRHISWAYGIHVEGFSSCLSGKYSSTWLIPTGVGKVYVRNAYLGRFSPVAIPTQVQVPETNTPSWRDCCQLVPGQV